MHDPLAIATDQAPDLDLPFRVGRDLGPEIGEILRGISRRMGPAGEELEDFGFEQLAVQGLMVLIIIAWVSVASLIVFGALKATIGLRVNEEEEVEGLDVPEHGMAGYSNDPSYA